MGDSRKAYVGWVVAAVCVGIAALAWPGRPSSSRPAPPWEEPSESGADDLSELRRVLERTRAESDALREELDRLVSNATGGDPLPRARRVEGERRDLQGEASGTEEPTGRSQDWAALAETAERYRDAVSRSIAGDEAAREEAYAAAMHLIRKGEDGFPALRDAYLSTSDPEVREVMLRAIIHGPGTEAEEFIARELRNERDPDLGAALAERAAQMATPDDAPIFRDTFLDLLQNAPGAKTAAAAARGLRQIRNDPEVDQALVDAANDPAPEVRLAAIHALASRRSMRDALERITEREADPEVHRVAECRLLVSNP